MTKNRLTAASPKSNSDVVACAATTVRVARARRYWMDRSLPRLRPALAGSIQGVVLPFTGRVYAGSVRRVYNRGGRSGDGSDVDGQPRSCELGSRSRRI